MNVLGEIGKLIFVGNFDGFVGSLEKGANALIVRVEVTDIFSGKRTHEVIDTVI